MAELLHMHRPAWQLDQSSRRGELAAVHPAAQELKCYLEQQNRGDDESSEHGWIALCR
jgi:hypothetical protein